MHLQRIISSYNAQGRPPFTRATVQAWRAALELKGLAPASVNQKLSAVRKLAAEAAYNGLLDPAAAQGIRDIRGAEQRGVRTGNWLTKRQAEALMAAPDPATNQGKRDASRFLPMSRVTAFAGVFDPPGAEARILGSCLAAARSMPPTILLAVFELAALGCGGGASRASMETWAIVERNLKAALRKVQSMMPSIQIALKNGGLLVLSSSFPPVRPR